MLQFNKQTLQFTYIQKSHLKSQILITNPTDQFAFFKFKITQPKYYLIKQDKGCIKPKENVTVDVTLHKDGVATAGCDKIKCFYSMGDQQVLEEPQNFERRSDTKTYKLTIKVNNLPPGFQKVPNQMKTSQVKSMQASQFGKSSKSHESLTLQKQIQQKQQEIVKIKNEMSTIRSSMQKTDVKEKAEPLSALVVWAVLGLVAGAVIGFYFY